MGDCLGLSRTYEGQQKNLKGCLSLLRIVMLLKSGLTSVKSMDDSLWILGSSR